MPTYIVRFEIITAQELTADALQLIKAAVDDAYQTHSSINRIK